MDENSSVSGTNKQYAKLSGRIRGALDEFIYEARVVDGIDDDEIAKQICGFVADVSQGSIRLMPVPSPPGGQP